VSSVAFGTLFSLDCQGSTFGLVLDSFWDCRETFADTLAPGDVLDDCSE
jgi:hypothetical protein